MYDHVPEQPEIITIIVKKAKHFSMLKQLSCSSNNNISETFALKISFNF